MRTAVPISLTRKHKVQESWFRICLEAMGMCVGRCRLPLQNNQSIDLEGERVKAKLLTGDSQRATVWQQLPPHDKNTEASEGKMEIILQREGEHGGACLKFQHPRSSERKIWTLKSVSLGYTARPVQKEDGGLQRHMDHGTARTLDCVTISGVSGRCLAYPVTSETWYPHHGGSFSLFNEV